MKRCNENESLKLSIHAKVVITTRKNLDLVIKLQEESREQKAVVQGGTEEFSCRQRIMLELVIVVPFTCKVAVWFAMPAGLRTVHV
jgi:hypothetical protein